MPPSFAASYEATPASIAIVRNQMAALAGDCGLDAQSVDGVRLAVSEAATNALVHGYRGGSGTIQVEAWLEDEQLVIAVCDQGGGMKPRPDSPGLGLGLPVIAQVADRLEIIENGPGTRLRMAFACPCSQVPADAALG
ncbi:MAG: ATP-binding protein [Solirubrobacteraceae bacterium]